MNIGFIGFGETAYNLASGLYAEGVREIRAYTAARNDGEKGADSHKSRRDMHAAFVESPQKIAAWADLVFADVTSCAALSVCREVKNCLHRGQLYVDMSTSVPSVKEAVWREIRDTGVYFVDAAFLNGPQRLKDRIFLAASGSGAALFKDTLSPYHVQVALAGDRPGSASAIHLLCSGFMGGLGGLMLETLEGAYAYGVAEEVTDVLGQWMDCLPFASQLNHLIAETGLYPGRGKSDLGKNAELLQEANVNPLMIQAAEKAHQKLLSFDFARKFAEDPPVRWEQIVDPLLTEAQK